MSQERRRADFFAPDFSTILIATAGSPRLRRRAVVNHSKHKIRQKGGRMIMRDLSGKLNSCSYRAAFLTFGAALGLCLCESASAQECLTSRQQLTEKKVSSAWRELHQKDNQPLYLTIDAGQGAQLRFVGRKPDGSTWISGALSICANAENRYQVKLDRIDQAPVLVGYQLTGMSGTIPAGSSRLKFGTGKHCGNPDPCIEFAATE
jgi:hypothetical protein